MSRTELLQRIANLSEEELARVAPYLEADLELVDEHDALLAEIALGQESARSEPLTPHADVMADVEHLFKKP